MGKTYRIAICDDEQIHLETIRQETEEILNRNACVYTINTYLSAEELLSAVKTAPNTFDTILLDILLDQNNGMDIAKELRNSGCASTIIFITRTLEFAVQGYEVNAFRYIMKPVRKEELEDALMSDYQLNRANKLLVFQNGSQTHRIEAKDVYYIETNGRGVTLYLVGEKLQLPIKISEMENMLPPSILARCHKSFIINVMHIEYISRQKISTSLNAFVPVGRKYYEHVKNTLMKYLAR